MTEEKKQAEAALIQRETELKRHLAELKEKHEHELEQMKSHSESQHKEARAEAQKSTSQNSMMAKIQEEMLQSLKANLATLEDENRTKDKSLTEFKA